MGLYCAFDAPVINKDLHESTGHVINKYLQSSVQKGAMK